MSDQRQAPLTITITEAAQRLGISKSHAYELAASGDLPALRLGRRVLVPLSALERLLASAEGSRAQSAVLTVERARGLSGGRRKVLRDQMVEGVGDRGVAIRRRVLIDEGGAWRRVAHPGH